MKVYGIKVEPTERGERYTIGCGNCGHSAVYERLVLERPNETYIIDKNVRAWVPETVADGPVTAYRPTPPVITAPLAMERVYAPPTARRKAPAKPKAKPAGKAKRR